MVKRIVKGSTAQTFLIVMWNNLLILLDRGLLFFTCLEVNFDKNRAVIKSQGPGIFPVYYKIMWSLATFIRNRRKIEPKEIRSCLILHLLVGNLKS